MKKEMPYSVTVYDIFVNTRGKCMISPYVFGYRGNYGRPAPVCRAEPDRDLDEKGMNRIDVNASG
jgi:hypothetical protein